MAYATSAALLQIIQLVRPDYSSVDAGIQGMATAEVDSQLVDYHIVPESLTDYNSLLSKAEIAFYMELGCKLGMFESRLGDLTQEQRGKFEKRYNTGMPMFFFAQGVSTSFYQLLQHETWRMEGAKFVRAYAALYSKKTGNLRFKTWAVYALDETERGYGWDATGYEVI